MFPVDCGFTYVLRLHFCELEPHINDIADRQFFIYIKSQLAEERADVMKWSKKQKGLAVHRNYAVMIPKNGNQKRFNISLQMHPYESGVDTTYSDAFLNGLEIFKISEAESNNLAGRNPDPVQSNSHAGPDPINNRRRMIGITAGVYPVLFSSRLSFSLSCSPPLPSGLHCCSQRPSQPTTTIFLCHLINAVGLPSSRSKPPPKTSTAPSSSATGDLATCTRASSRTAKSPSQSSALDRVPSRGLASS